MPDRKLAVYTWTDDQVLLEVADMLSDRNNFDIDFLSRDELLNMDWSSEDYDFLLDKKRNSEEELNAIKRAEEEQVRTFIGYEVHSLLNDNKLSKQVLEQSGLKIPEMSQSPFEGRYVVKPQFETDEQEPYLDSSKHERDNRDNLFFEKFLEDAFEGSEYKLYGIWTDQEFYSSGVKRESPLFVENEGREQFELDSEMENILQYTRDALQNALDTSNIRILGVDVIEHENDYYVVDVNSGPSFRGTDSESELTEAIEQAYAGDEI